MPRPRNDSDSSYKLPLEQIYNCKVLVPDFEMTALSNACAYFNVQAHRSLVPINEKDYEVVLQISALSRESAMNTMFYLGAMYSANLKLTPKV